MQNQKKFSELPTVLGVKISALSSGELLHYIISSIQNNRRSLILHVNVHGINLAYKHIWLRDFLNTAEIVFSDGAGIILGARILNFHIPERITYADWMWQLGEFAEENELSLFFLGAAPGVADYAAIRLKERFPNLQIKGIHHGYFDKNFNSKENRMVIEMINAVKPNILLIGFGMPLQEKWLMDNWNEITNVDVALTGGAVFDYISGNLRRAPRWLTANGFEWLGRLVIEPRRLWKRYIIGNPIFLWRVLMQKFGFLKYD